MVLADLMIYDGCGMGYVRTRYLVMVNDDRTTLECFILLASPRCVVLVHNSVACEYQFCLRLMISYIKVLIFVLVDQVREYVVKLVPETKCLYRISGRYL